MSLTDWISAAAALATMIMAAATVFLATKTRASAEAAKEQAQLTREQGAVLRQEAEAVREQAEIARRTLEHLQATRELARRPLLVVQSEWLVAQAPERLLTDRRPPGQANPLDDSQNDLHYDLGAVVVNAGGGPAVDVFVAHNNSGRGLRRSREPVTIGAHERAEILLTQSTQEDALVTPPSDLFMVRRPDGHQGFVLNERRYVLACRDERGESIYRFASASPGFDEWRLAGKRAPWASGLENMAPWLKQEPSQ